MCQHTHADQQNNIPERKKEVTSFPNKPDSPRLYLIITQRWTKTSFSLMSSPTTEPPQDLTSCTQCDSGEEHMLVWSPHVNNTPPHKNSQQVFGLKKQLRWEDSVVPHPVLNSSLQKLVLLIKLNNARSDETLQGIPLRLVPTLACWPTYAWLLCGGSLSFIPPGSSFFNRILFEPVAKFKPFQPTAVYCNNCQSQPMKLDYFYQRGGLIDL